MVEVMFGKKLPHAIVNIDVYFNNRYRNEWFDDENVKQVVRDIDHSEIEGCVLKSPVLGNVSVEKLSGGAKAIIVMLKDDTLKFPINLIVCGSNCENWLEYCFKHRDLTVCTTGLHIRFLNRTIEGKCLNDNTYFTDWHSKMIEFLEEYNDREN